MWSLHASCSGSWLFRAELFRFLERFRDAGELCHWIQLPECRQPVAAAEARPAGLGWGELAGQALDAVSSRIAIVDESGTIVAVNRAWRVFAHTHGASDRQACEGTNFFKACAAPDDPQHDVAMQVVDGLQHVLDGILPMFDGEEPCRLPHDLLWSEVRISPLKVDGRTMAIVSPTTSPPKRVELALRDIELALERAQAIAKVGSWTADFDAGVYVPSAQAVRLGDWEPGPQPFDKPTASFIQTIARCTSGPGARPCGPASSTSSTGC